MNEIPSARALTICEQLQADNRGKWYTYQYWWCWGCTTFTKGDASQRCFANAPGNRGCDQVNQVYDRLPVVKTSNQAASERLQSAHDKMN